ncbi:alanine racemase [Oceanirhabdus seepicola]|uniref:Alanine racemase n=1 Tax=Oceanirhabdus seepicola TaxID=2828781 RepID=A0A9J6NWT9_9CLOT|nr:alanine racemase [Oceanirhabdus seepicola]MCM1988462.1 alanine racemase [Oceanirhabdus seepicola]
MRNIRPVWAEINLDNLAHNMREIRRVSKSKEIMAVVKADAYGHGALDTAPILLKNGADKLAVAIADEGRELREGGIKAPILVLGWTTQDQVKDIVEYDLECTVLSYEFAKALSNEAKRRGKIAKIHIKVDSGMGRIGFLPTEESIEEISQISKLTNIVMEGLFSHFSDADNEKKEYSEMQNKRYRYFIEKLKEKEIFFNTKHIGNSAAIIDLPEYHYDMVRPGIILYGYYPSDEVRKDKIDLKPVLSLKAKIANIKKVEKNEYIGYGRKYQCDGESIIGTLPIGYADGYSRMLSGFAKAIVSGKIVPVVGRICMDQCMIDLTQIDNVNIGDEVILIGEDGNNKLNADYIASGLNTISYEVLCMIGKRVPRVYVENSKVMKIRKYV